MTERRTRKRTKGLLILGAVLIVLAFLILTAEINVYGLVCWVHHFEPTPNAAWLRMNEDRPQELMVDESTPVYTWQADESNAICCFVTDAGILTERMYTKNGGFYATGWGGGLEYGQEQELPKETEDYAAARRILPSGLYGDEIRYCLVKITDSVPRDRLVLTFRAKGEEYGILVP